MRLLVISDVHADARALERVLAHSADHAWEEVLFLGDAVGYGGSAHQAVARLMELPLRTAIRGNHEVMLNQLRAGRRPAASQQVVAALEANLRELDSADLEFLDGLRTLYLDETWGAVHGALRNPFEYLISVPVARSNAESMERDSYFVGHTHVPSAYLQEAGGRWTVRPFTRSEGSVTLVPGMRAFLNPGSVSLPRDRIPGNSYGIYDEESRKFSVFRLP